MVVPFIVCSECGNGFLRLGGEILRDGGSAMDAVEAAIRCVVFNAWSNNISRKSCSSGPCQIWIQPDNCPLSIYIL